MIPGVLLFSAVLDAAVGAFALVVAVHERGNRSSPWWALPGTFGAVLLAMSVVKLALWTVAV